MTKDNDIQPIAPASKGVAPFRWWRLFYFAAGLALFMTLAVLFVYEVIIRIGGVLDYFTPSVTIRGANLPQDQTSLMLLQCVDAGGVHIDYDELLKLHDLLIASKRTQSLDEFGHYLVGQGQRKGEAELYSGVFICVKALSGY